MALALKLRLLNKNARVSVETGKRAHRVIVERDHLAERRWVLQLRDRQLLNGDHDKVLRSNGNNCGTALDGRVRVVDLEKTAGMIVDMLNTEALTRVSVAFGTIVNEIKDVSRSYKEAKMALDVGKIFYSTKNVVAYSKLGIGRLIYQLPLPLCRMFIKEIFDGKSPDEFDEETLTTINKFFENSLNVSETSRQLYIHRNTLVYRLDKLQKLLGLNIRNFEDAMLLRLGLMVHEYVKEKAENIDEEDI